MREDSVSGRQAVDIEAALRWADRHEARERQKLRDMGLPPEGDMPVTGAFFVRRLVAMLRTAAPTAPSTAAGEDRGEVVREAIASVFDKGSDEIIALRDASSFHSVSHDALTTYASNLAGWAQQIRDMPLPPPSPPWQEQAAQWHEEQAGHAAVLALAEPSLSGASHFLQAEVAHHQHARDLRALLSKPAKGVGE